jgi:beta-galactosidase
LLDGQGIVWKAGDIRYVSGWPDHALLSQILCRMADEAGLDTLALPEGLRVRRAGRLAFAFNYSTESIDLPDAPATFVLGGAMLPPAGCAVWSTAPVSGY